jgi:hypothetical protein
MSRSRRSWLPKWPTRPRSNCLHSARLRVEEMERRITPATFNVLPPASTSLDAAALRSAGCHARSFGRAC